MTIQKEYNKNGFLIIKNFFDANEQKKILSKINDLFIIKLSLYNEKYFNFYNYKNLFLNMNKLFNINQIDYLSTIKLAANLIDIKRVCSSLELENMIKNIGLKKITIPTDPVLHVISKELQVDGGYLGFEPHQDWVSMQGSINSAIAWFPLCPVDSSNFPIQVVPGSHLMGMMDNKCVDSKKIDSNNGNETSLNINIPEDNFINVIANEGDLVIFSSWLIHRTGIHPGREPRIAISTRFEDFTDLTWANRNYPSAYKKVVERRLITPEFPSAEQVRSIFDE